MERWEYILGMWKLIRMSAFWESLTWMASPLKVIFLTLTNFNFCWYFPGMGWQAWGRLIVNWKNSVVDKKYSSHTSKQASRKGNHNYLLVHCIYFFFLCTRFSIINYYLHVEWLYTTKNRHCRECNVSDRDIERFGSC